MTNCIFPIEIVEIAIYNRSVLKKYKILEKGLGNGSMPLKDRK